MPVSTTVTIRVRYSETDQMGTFYNSRALEWFEVARTELLRQAGIAYVDCEKRNVMLPLVEAHVNYQGRARYDDELRLAVSAQMDGRAKARFDIVVTQADGRPVASGWTVHAITDSTGKPTRPPQWFVDALKEV